MQYLSNCSLVVMIEDLVSSYDADKTEIFLNIFKTLLGMKLLLCCSLCFLSTMTSEYYLAVLLNLFLNTLNGFMTCLCD